MCCKSTENLRQIFKLVLVYRMVPSKVKESIKKQRNIVRYKENCFELLGYISPHI